MREHLSSWNEQTERKRKKKTKRNKVDRKKEVKDTVMNRQRILARDQAQMDQFLI